MTTDDASIDDLLLEAEQADKDAARDREIAATMSIIPYQVMSARDVALVRRTTTIYAHLRPDQFLVNICGFPIIPNPEPREEVGHVKLAPANVSPEFLGHPMYWIAPSLTQRHDDEPELDYTIRMFVLIAGFGLWNKDFSPVDVLADRFGYDASANETDVLRYLTNPEAVTDLGTFDFLEADRLRIRESELDEKARKIRSLCLAEIDRTITSYFDTQNEAVLSAQQLLGPNRMSPTADPTDGAGYWKEHLAGKADDLYTVYVEVAEMNASMRVVENAAREFSTLVLDAVRKMNEATAHLVVPSLSKVSTVYEAYAVSIHYQNLALKQANALEGDYDLEGQIAAAFGVNVNDDPPEDRIVALIDYLAVLYTSAWERLRFAYVNYHLILGGSEITESYETMIDVLGDDERRPSELVGADANAADDDLVSRFLEN